MVTIDQLKNEILELRGSWEEKLLALFQQSTEQLSAEQKRDLDTKIQIVNSRISENNQIITEKEKQITAKENQISADKKFRAERGETNSSPMLFIFFH